MTVIHSLEPIYSVTLISTSPTVYINSYALKGIGVQYRNPTGGFDPISMPTGWVLPRLNDTFRVRTYIHVYLAKITGLFSD